MRRCFAIFLGFLLGFGAVLAQAAGSFDPEKDITVAFRKGAVVVQAPAGVHLKAAFMAVAKGKDTPGTLKVGPLPATQAKDELGDPIWRGKVVIPVAGSGLQGEVALTVTFQPCVEGEGGVCYAPADRVLKVKAAEIPPLEGPAPTVKQADKPALPSAAPAEPAPAEAEAPRPAAAPAAAPAGPRPGAGALGLLLGFLTVFLAGLLSAFTPCVFPMIPITMAIIGAKGGGKAKGFLLSMCLVLGIGTTYTALGVFAAASGAAFGAAAQSPAFLIPVALLFAALALSLFGAFELQLPDALQSRLQGGAARSGYLGAFLKGMILGPLSAPCVGPVIGSVLIAIAQEGKVALGAAKLFTFALGMGVPFMAVGTFSASLPRSGDWMIRFKRIMGLMVLGYAIWTVRLLVPEWALLALVAVCQLIASAVFGLFEPAEGFLGQIRKGFAILVLVSAIGNALVAGLLVQKPEFLSGLRAPAAAQASQDWLSQDLEAALARAKAENKLVLVDTYAEWCAQCKELDETTWPDPEVAAWIRANAVAVRIDTDKARKDLAPRLGIRSYPTVLLLDAQGREQRRLLGFQKPAEMLKFLKG